MGHQSPVEIKQARESFPGQPLRGPSTLLALADPDADEARLRYHAFHEVVEQVSENLLAIGNSSMDDEDGIINAVDRALSYKACFRSFMAFMAIKQTMDGVPALSKLIQGVEGRVTV
jgi:hypothetical protein